MLIFSRLKCIIFCSYPLMEYNTNILTFYASEKIVSFQIWLFQKLFFRCYSFLTFTSLNMNGLSLSLKSLPLVVVTFLRITSRVIT